jgi:hypothetical protein
MLRNYFNNAIPQTRIMPLPALANVGANASAKAQTVSVSGGGGPELLVNGVENPIQDILNLSGTGVSYGPNPGEVLFVGAVQYTLKDNFAYCPQEAVNFGAANVPAAFIGQLGWALAGFTGNEGGQYGGPLAHYGQFGWSNDEFAQDAGWLLLNQSNGQNNSGFSCNGFASAEASGSVFTYIFKIDANVNLTFNPLQKSIYVGLVSPIDGSPGFTTYSQGSTVSRPNYFIGARFDTSTTSPSINDAFFTLEVVANPVFTTNPPFSRNNAQGATFVTTIVPTAGVWHTLTIGFSGTNVTINLDGQTFTTAIPTVTVSGSVGGYCTGQGLARVDWTPASTALPVGPWGVGSQLTIAGFTGAFVGLNGVQALTLIDSGSFAWFNSALGNIGSQSDTVTLTGYPAFLPCAMFGNDDTASPGGPDMMFFMDDFSLIL